MLPPMSAINRNIGRTPAQPPKRWPEHNRLPWQETALDAHLVLFGAVNAFLRRVAAEVYDDRCAHVKAA